MSKRLQQSLDPDGAADYLGITKPTVIRRWNAGKFPIPDLVENDVPWWQLDTLDKYKQSLARKRRK